MKALSMVTCTIASGKLCVLLLFCSIAACYIIQYEYSSEPETWYEASRKCQDKGKNLANAKPDNAKTMNEKLANMSLWMYGYTEIKFWTVHKVKKSSVTMFAEIEDDKFPYDNKLVGENDLYCALGVFYTFFEKIHWIAEPCYLLHEYYCTEPFPFPIGSTDVFYEEQTDWETANRRCQEEGGDLTMFNYIQSVEYAKYFYYNTSVWYPFRKNPFWTRHKRLRNLSNNEEWPITGLDVTRTSQHCVFAFTEGANAFWSTDDCRSHHRFICEMQAPSEDVYFFFEMPNLSVQNVPILKLISNSKATLRECEDICRKENDQNLECSVFEVNFTSGTCTTYVQYFMELVATNEEINKTRLGEWSNDSYVYDLHYIQGILGNTTKNTSTIMQTSTEFVTIEITTPHATENKGRLVTQQSTTSYQNSQSTWNNVTDPTALTSMTKQTPSSNIPFWLLSGFGAVSSIVATTWLGIIIKRSKDIQKIHPVEQETSNETLRSNQFGGLRSF